MVIKKLITLKKIAEELKINYNTLISCKKYFEEYLIVKNIGRTPKYPDAYIDFFRLVFALKDEGFVMPEIKRIIIENDSENIEASLAEWISKWHNDVFNERLIEPTNDLLNESLNDLTNEPVTEPTNDLLNDLTNERLNNCFIPIKEEILSALPGMITDQTQPISDSHESTISELTAQLNSAITQFFKATVQIQVHLKDLHKRLQYLEKELGADPEADMSFTELDLEKLQVSLRQSESTQLQSNAELDLVKESVAEGKPDRDAIRQWIQAERERNPSVSYAELAEMLDSAGIPTLRGGYGWNRGTLRNLIVK